MRTQIVVALLVLVVTSTGARAQPLPYDYACGACIQPREADVVTVKPRSKVAIWAPGLALWMGSYFGSIMAGLQHGDMYTSVPVLGALGTGVVYGLNDDAPRAVGYLFGGFGQMAGMITFIVGLASGPDKMARMPVQLAPLSSRDGGGMNMSVKF